MNKKFTMMVAALLAAGGFSANAADFNLKKEAVKLANGDQIYLVIDAEETPSTNFVAGEKAIGATLKGTNLTYSTANFTSESTFSTATDAEVVNYLWTVEVTKGVDGDYYSFKNAKTGKYLAFDKNGNFVTTAANAVSGKSYIQFSNEGQGNVTDEEYAANPKITLKARDLGATVAEVGGALVAKTETPTDEQATIYAYKADSKGVTAAELNEKMGGDGFSLAPVEAANAVTEENNIFGQHMLAVEIAENFKNEVTKEEVPAGLYFVVEGAENLKFADGKVKLSAFLEEGESWEGQAIQDATERAFDAINSCTFVAVSSWDNYATTSVNDYSGLKLTTISGNDLVKYNQTVENGKYATSKQQIYIANAKFTVIENDQYAKPGEYVLTVNDARVKEVGKDSHKKQELPIGVTKIAGTNYITTVKDATAFKVSTSSLFNAMELLNTEKAAAIYRIKFVSKTNETSSEAGKLFGVAYDGSKEIFVAQGEDLVNPELPQHLFTITDIDANKIVTFQNIETGAVFKTQLHSTDVENQYKLINAQVEVRIAKEAAKDLSNYTDAAKMTGMVVELESITDLDAYVGFLKKGIDNNEPYRLVFAKNATTDDKLYVAEKEETKNNPNDTELSETESLQFVFEPVTKTNDKNTIDEEVVSTKFAYNNDGKVYYASEKLVKYYTYRLREVNTEENNYVKWNNNALTLGNAKGSATEFIVKFRHDGSVALIDASTKLSESSKALSAKINGKSLIISDAYGVPSTKVVNLYLEEEKVGVSLEAKSGHYTFAAENGGFINVNEKNEGVIAIRTEAAEDLTFWVDTTNSEKLIPSFYISKGGKFMYNSADSAKINGKQNPAYIVEVDGSKYAKAVFKAGELVDSNTLKTTVDNKEVIVAAVADQNKGILDGIKDFQFQIIKPSDAEDNYVIRTADGSKYVSNFNGVLGFISSKEDAMRVIVEGAAAPTSNEGVSASEVKVIANNGSINVKNAAGKNVVVSTILGQVVANEVLTSDNATINVPAGIVVVAVEGESFKVNVK